MAASRGNVRQQPRPIVKEVATVNGKQGIVGWASKIKKKEFRERKRVEEEKVFGKNFRLILIRL